MGAKSSVAAPRGWAGPAALWTGVLAPPIAWSLYVGIGYPLAQWTCAQGRPAAISLVAVAALLVVAGAAFISWRALQVGSAEPHSEAGALVERTRFMAQLGLSSSVLFALVIVVSDVTRWMIDGCH